MDRRLAVGAMLAVPALYALLLGLTAALGPLAGWALGLCAYWAALGGAMLALSDREALGRLVFAEWPGRLVALALAAPVVVMGAITMRTLGQVVLPGHIIVAAALGAIANAVLEEMFWRGALLPRPSPRAAALALGAFGLFHVAWLGARGLETGLSPLVLALGPFALGGVWMAAFLSSGTLGAAILSHAGVNLFLFTRIAALNWEAG